MLLLALIAAVAVFAYVRGWLTLSWTGIKDPILSIGVLGILIKLSVPKKPEPPQA